MPKQTIFWKHPQFGDGRYTIEAATAKDAGENAADELPGDWVDDDPEPFEEDRIRDDLTVKVWTGEHTTMPTSEPDYELV